GCHPRSYDRIGDGLCIFFSGNCCEHKDEFCCHMMMPLSCDALILIREIFLEKISSENITIRPALLLGHNNDQQTWRPAPPQAYRFAPVCLHAFPVLKGPTLDHMQ